MKNKKSNKQLAQKLMLTELQHLLSLQDKLTVTQMDARHHRTEVDTIRISRAERELERAISDFERDWGPVL